MDFMVMKLSSHPIKLQSSLSLPCQQNWWYLISWNSHWDRPNSNKPTWNPRTAFILTLGVMLEITVEEFQWTNWKHTRSQDRSELPKKCQNFRGVGTSFTRWELPRGQNFLQILGATNNENQIKIWSNDLQTSWNWNQSFARKCSLCPKDPHKKIIYTDFTKLLKNTREVGFWDNSKFEVLVAWIQ